MPGFVKDHPDAATAQNARRRAAALRRAGVPTPAARPGRTATEVDFDRIDGMAILPLPETPLADLLGPVARLHDTPVPGLTAHDPFRRIRPRLSLATAGPVREVLRDPVPTGTATLHGDLHLGQFMRDDAGRVWIVDLDDLCLGPPEADLANFAGHLATSRPGGVALWANRVQDAWHDLQRCCDAVVFTRFLRFALVRRHLKLRAAGRPDHEGMVADYLRDSSNFSIR